MVHSFGLSVSMVHSFAKLALDPMPNLLSNVCEPAPNTLAKLALDPMPNLQSNVCEPAPNALAKLALDPMPL